MDENNFSAIQIQGISADALIGKIKETVKELIPQPQTETTPNRLLTRKEVCKMLQISEVTLWSWTKAGILTAYRIGNKIRYKENEVLQALQNTNPKHKAK